MRLQVLEVTPQQAKAWLKLNTLNRPVRQRYVTYLAEAMKRGEWVVNHQPIALNGNRLIDGQHRLMAVVESGLPGVKLPVVMDADTNTFDTIDIGAKRSNADIFREDVNVMNPITMVARLVHGGSNVAPRSVKPIYEKLHKAMREVVDSIPRNTKKWTSSPIRVGALAAILNGESKTYVLGLYKAMADFDTKKLPPVAASFVKQVMLGQKAAINGSKSNDLLVRAFTVFQAENADLERVMVKKQGERLAQIREIYKRNLGIK